MHVRAQQSFLLASGMVSLRPNGLTGYLTDRLTGYLTFMVNATAAGRSLLYEYRTTDRPRGKHTAAVQNAVRYT